MPTFAERLRKVREAKGVTPYRLAQLTGLSKQGVLNLELDGADPKISTVEKLAEALGCGVAELLRESTPVDQPAAAPQPPRRKPSAKSVAVVDSAALISKLDACIKELKKSNAAMSVSFVIHTVWEVKKAIEVLASTPVDQNNSKPQEKSVPKANPVAHFSAGTQPQWTEVPEQLSSIASTIKAMNALEASDEQLGWKLVQSLEATARVLLQKSNALRKKHQL